jgi:hypothetical protein
MATHNYLDDDEFDPEVSKINRNKSVAGSAAAHSTTPKPYRRPDSGQAFQSLSPQSRLLRGAPPYSLPPPNEWFTHNQRTNRTMSPGCKLTPMKSSLMGTLTSTTPDSIVLAKMRCKSVPPQSRAHLDSLSEKVKNGQTWSLAPEDNSGIHDPSTQMAELEDFKPAGGVRALITQTTNPHRVYKMGKWSPNAQIVWDYHKEKSQPDMHVDFSPFKEHAVAEVNKINIQISDVGDDGQEDRTTGISSTMGGMLTLDADTTVALRFRNVAIPQKALILSAHLHFVSAPSKTKDSSIQIYAEAADDAKEYNEREFNCITRRLRTSNKEMWAPGRWWHDGNVKTGELKEVVQEVVNRPGWRSGNAMAFYMTTLEGVREVCSSTMDFRKAAGLSVEWSLA